MVGSPDVSREFRRRADMFHRAASVAQPFFYTAQFSFLRLFISPHLPTPPSSLHAPPSPLLTSPPQRRPLPIHRCFGLHRCRRMSWPLPFWLLGTSTLSPPRPSLVLVLGSVVKISFVVVLVLVDSFVDCDFIFLHHFPRFKVLPWCPNPNPNVPYVLPLFFLPLYSSISLVWMCVVI